ncbi:DUF4178 domain-containing protein [Wenyingzhuangia sp. 2_MG-2023]|uniref:DUF4178 domain-containing protein n=1 Tax=Wenyingzhuangia sp. 2_MG-2023 TaxID=3062639 RepID=UPI0026E13A0A|nr:DUF4178 domain-containing protein [Wenyingzhuangia sp. 2_MG-2023]MDO6736913.1 DUF4178 domain-containing protein [Wenyingzhuangia sp. 2_MG-2023]MDO6801917.1 DUF4178 domain-containing protein [Wenyingzhuangia sp. 1_MG-2023]
MGIFDFFKKKETERHFDPLNIKVADLEKNYLLDYQFETWTVAAMFEYDWGNNYFTREYTLVNGKKKKYLEIEDDGGIILTMSEGLKLRKLGDDVTDHIDRNNEPPKKIVYEGVLYYLDEKSPGYSRNVDNENWEELISFDYLDDEEEKTLCITQYGEHEFEACRGIIIKERDISNILPSQQDN